MGGISASLSSTTHIIQYRDFVVILASGRTWARKEGQTMFQCTDIQCNRGRFAREIE